MKRDLVFFVAGLGFGIAAGYFVFRAVLPEGGARASVPLEASPQSSPIGLADEPRHEELDEQEVQRLVAQAQQSPNDAEVRARIGELYLSAGRYEDAAAWLKKVVELAPDNLLARNHLALSYLNLGRMDDATATYEETLRIAPDHPASLLGLGRIRLYLQRDIDGGLALWEKLIAVAPESAEARSVREELEAMKSAHSGS